MTSSGGYIPKIIVFCFHCGEKFQKKKDKFEDCPFCGKGYDDLSKESQFAVAMMLKTNM